MLQLRKHHAMRALSAAFFFFSSAAAAQVTTGALGGRVSTPDGTAIPEATITVVHIPTGARYTAHTDAQGRYLLANLKPGGPYAVAVRHMGMQPAGRDDISVTLGTTAHFNFAMEAAAVSLSAVTVKGELADEMSTRRTGPQTTVGRDQIMTLPTLSRSIQDMTRLTPSGNANSFGGSNFRYNNITVDGASSNDVFGFSNSYGGISGVGPSGTPGAGAKSQPISLDAIDQVTVSIAPYDVTLGNFSGASINAVTRSGTNTTTGSFYSFGRNQTLTGRSADPTRTTIPAYADYQYGGRMGGPVKQDKAFYFFSAEIARRHEPLQFAPGDAGTVVDAQTASALNDTVKARLGTSAGSIGAYDIAAKSTKLFGRLDLNLGEVHKLSIRNNYIKADAGQLSRGVLNVAYGSQDYIQHSTNNGTVAELRSNFANGVSNVLIGSATFTRDGRTPNGVILPQIEINGPSGSTILMGTNREAAIWKVNTNIFELTDNLTRAVGRNTFTLGTHNELYNIQYYFQNAWNGRWQYSSIANFNANKPSRIRGTYVAQGDNSYAAVSNMQSANFRVLWPSAYAQDEIALTDRLHVTAGLRVDAPILPDQPGPNAQFLNTSYNGTTPFAKYNEKNIGGKVYVAPRLSFNWDAKGDQTLQVRGGTGVFTSRVPFAWPAYDYYNNGVRFNNVDCRPSATSGCAGNSATVPLVDGSRLSTLQSGVYEMNVIQNNFKMPTVLRTSVGLDKKFNTGTTVTFEGVYTKTLSDIKFLNVGLKDSTTVSAIDGRPIFLGSPVQERVNPNITSVFLLTNTSKGYRYNLTGQLRQVLGSVRGSVAYTYGQAFDVSNGIRNSPQSNWEYNQVRDPRNPGLSYSNFDIRHRVVGSLLYNHDWKPGYSFGASFVFTGVSGSPFSYVYNGDANRDGSSNNDLLYVPKDFADAHIVPAAGDSRTAQQIWDQFDAFIRARPELESHRGQIIGRNMGHTPWNKQIDMRISQDLPAALKSGHSVQLSLDVINLGALLGTTLGRQYFVPNENNYNFYSARITQNAGQGGAPSGFSFDPIKDNKPYQYDPLNSRWQAQFGIRYNF